MQDGQRYSGWEEIARIAKIAEIAKIEKLEFFQSAFIRGKYLLLALFALIRG